MQRSALWAALGLLGCLALLKPINTNLAFIAAFFYQLYVPGWLGYAAVGPALSRNLAFAVAWISILTFGLYGLGYWRLESYWAAQSGYELTFRPGFSWSLLLGFLTNLLVIAYPEEFFYRGYLQSSWKGVSGILALNVLFALGHFVGDYDPARLLPFFPGLLFSWLAYRSGSIMGATLYHALCNTFSEWLGASFYWSQS